MAEEEEKVEGASADAEAPSGEEAGDEAAAEAVEAAQDAEADEKPVETVVPESASADTEAPQAKAAAEPAADPTGEPAADEPEPAAEVADGGPTAGGASAAAEAPRKKKRLPRAERRQRTTQPGSKPAERKPIVRLEKPEHERGRRQERQGTVVSDAMEKTIVVEVHMIKAHPKYRKVVRRSTKFHAHDETNQAKVGDVVRIVETRPLSKQKRWRLVEVLEVAK